MDDKIKDVSQSRQAETEPPGGQEDFGLRIAPGTTKRTVVRYYFTKSPNVTPLLSSGAWFDNLVCSEEEERGLAYFGEVGVRVSDAAAITSEIGRTRQLMVEKFDEVAKKRDLEEAKNEIIESLNRKIQELESELATARNLQDCERRLAEGIRSESEATRAHLTKELEELRGYVRKFAPYKRFFRATFAFFCFFWITLVAGFTTAVKIVEPFWALIGVLFTGALLVVVYSAKKDEEGEASRRQ